MPDRAAVEVDYLRELIAGGYVGKVLSTTLIGSGGNWSEETEADLAYLFDAKSGASMQSIPLAQRWRRSRRCWVRSAASPRPLSAASTV